MLMGKPYMVASASSSELKFQSQMCMGPFKGDDLEWKIDNKTRKINKSENSDNNKSQGNVYAFTCGCMCGCLCE